MDKSNSDNKYFNFDDGLNRISIQLFKNDLGSEIFGESD